MRESHFSIGIDLGGTKMEGVLLNSKGEIVHRKRVPTEADKGYEVVLDNLANLVYSLDEKAGETCRVGVATPGTISSVSGLLCNCNSINLNGQPLLSDLCAAVGREVRMANDANCFALSEAVDGIARGYAVVFGVILGTGVGGGLVVNGRVHRGLHGIAGEWGHNPMPGYIENRNCYCGKTDCVERWLCGSGLLRSYHQIGGEESCVEDLVDRANRGGELELKVIEEYAQQLAQALAVVVNTLDPDVIVIGGGLSNIDSLYQLVPRFWKQYVFNDEVRTPLLRAKFGDSSGVRGAAWLW